jgi:hypothetical protein
MESTFGNGSFKGVCRAPGVNLAADGKTRPLMSIEGCVCWSGAVLSVDDGVGGARRGALSAEDASGTFFGSARSAGPGTAGGGPDAICRDCAGAGAVGFVAGRFLTDRTVDTGLDSFFTSGA